MKKVSTPLLLLLVAWPGRSQLLSRVQLARWPEDRVAAVSLTFDDAMNSQLDNAVPILRKHDLKARFIVTTGSEAWRKRTPEWKRLAEEGNELGNHTVNHPCLLPEITPHSQDFTPESMRSEISDAARDITKVYPSHRGLTFAYPCGNMSFGPPQDQVRNAALYIRFVSEYAFAARGAAGGGAQNPDE